MVFIKIYQIKNIFPNETPDISNDILFRNKKDCYKKLQSLEKNWGENYYIQPIPLKIVSELDYDKNTLLYVLKDLKNNYFKIYKNKSSAAKQLNDNNILITCIIPININKKHLL